MNLNDYLDPIDLKFAIRDFTNPKDQLISSVSVHTSEKKTSSPHIRGDSNNSNGFWEK